MGAPAVMEGVEVGIARDIARHALPLAPLIVLGGAVLGGVDGAWSALLGLAIVVANVGAAARIATWAAGISPQALYASTLGGYVVRLGAITGLVLALRGWVDVVALGLAIVVSQLTLLTWEVRSVSHSLQGASLQGRAGR